MKTFPWTMLALLCAAVPASAENFDCIVKPQTEIELSAPVSGVIAETLVDRGSMVSKGDIVARLTSEVEQANLNLFTRRASAEEKTSAARLRIDFLTRKLERNETLNQQSIVSNEVVDEVRTELSLAQEELKSALAERELAALEKEQAAAVLAQKVIRSPITGVVMQLLRKTGEFTSDRTAIARLASLDPLTVEVFLPVSMHGQIAVGLKAAVSTEALPGQSFTATVSVVDPVYDAASGTVGVQLSLPNPKLAIPAGTRCDLRFATQ